MDEQAFPTLDYGRTDGERVYYQHKGMTLRDYFAAKAMQGMLASGSLMVDKEPLLLPRDADKLAGTFYSMADAMLRARETQR
jgi:hypothetical protein